MSSEVMGPELVSSLISAARIMDEIPSPSLENSNRPNGQRVYEGKCKNTKHNAGI